MDTRQRILFSFLALVLSSTIPAWAQQAAPDDEIVVKSVDGAMFQITANMKLTPDQISAIRQIVTDHIVKLRDLHLSLQNGTIDGKAMYEQRLQLLNDEAQALSQILTSDQMKLWSNLQQE